MASGYETLDKIGQGSFGAVFRVRRRSDGRLFARKEMRFRGVPPAEQLAAEREVRLLRELKNPFVLAHVDSYIDDDCLNVIVELCENGDLGKAIQAQRQRGRPLDDSLIWRVFIETTLGASAFCAVSLHSQREHQLPAIIGAKPVNFRFPSCKVLDILIRCSYD